MLAFLYSFKFEKTMDREVSYFNNNSENYNKCQCSETDKALICFQFISIKGCTEISVLLTLCIT